MRPLLVPLVSQVALGGILFAAMQGSSYSELQLGLTFCIMLLVSKKRYPLERQWSLVVTALLLQVSTTLVYFAVVVSVDIHQQLQSNRARAGLREAARSLWSRNTVLTSTGVASASTGIVEKVGGKKGDDATHVVSNPLFLRSGVSPAGLGHVFSVYLSSCPTLLSDYIGYQHDSCGARGGRVPRQGPGGGRQAGHPLV